MSCCRPQCAQRSNRREMYVRIRTGTPVTGTGAYQGLYYQLIPTGKHKTNARQRRTTQGNARKASNTKATSTTPANRKPKTAHPEHKSKPPPTKNRKPQANRTSLPSKPPTETYLNRQSQPNPPRTTLDPPNLPRQLWRRTSHFEISSAAAAPSRISRPQCSALMARLGPFIYDASRPLTKNVTFLTSNAWPTRPTMNEAGQRPFLYQPPHNYIYS